MIDTHAHLDAPPLYENLSQVLQRAREIPLSHIIAVGTSLQSSHMTVELAEKYDFIFASVGVHPDDIHELDQETNRKHLEKLSRFPKVKAVGEIGLDYFRLPIEDTQKREQQREYFIFQIRLAKQHNLPVIIHSRDSASETLEIIGKERPQKAVLHCYSYDLPIAQEFLSLSPTYMISFTGIITFPNATMLQNVVTALPLQRLMVETDCPLLAPQIYRGKTNEPAYVVEVAKKMAELKKLELSVVENTTDDNAKRFFNL